MLMFFSQVLVNMPKPTLWVLPFISSNQYKIYKLTNVNSYKSIASFQNEEGLRKLILHKDITAHKEFRAVPDFKGKKHTP